MADWCSCSATTTRSRSMPISSIRRNSSRSRVSRYSATSWLPTRSAGISEFHRGKIAQQRLAIWHGHHACDLRIGRRIAIQHGSHAAHDVAGAACGSHNCGSLLHPMVPPTVTGGEHVPLWKIAGPHTGKLKPGPSRGPVFYRALLSARHSAKSRGVNVVRAPRLHAIVLAEMNWENERSILPEKFL